MRCSNASLRVLEKLSFFEKLSSQMTSRRAFKSNNHDTISLSFSSSITVLCPVILMYALKACRRSSRAFTREKREYILWRSPTRFASISIRNPWKNTQKSYFKHESRISLDKGYKFDYLEILEDSPDHAVWMTWSSSKGFSINVAFIIRNEQRSETVHIISDCTREGKRLHNTTYPHQ